MYYSAAARVCLPGPRAAHHHGSAVYDVIPAPRTGCGSPQKGPGHRRHGTPRAARRHRAQVSRADERGQVLLTLSEVRDTCHESLGTPIRGQAKLARVKPVTPGSIVSCTCNYNLFTFTVAQSQSVTLQIQSFGSSSLQTCERKLIPLNSRDQIIQKYVLFKASVKNQITLSCSVNDAGLRLQSVYSQWGGLTASLSSAAGIRL